MVDLVLRIQSIGPDWLIQVDNAQVRVAPLTDHDLQRAALARTPASQPSILPPEACTWKGLLAHLRPNDEWQPGARVLEMVGSLLHDRLICGKVADHVVRIEAAARARRVGLRYVVHVFEGEEDGLLPQLPFELLHRGSFWFRRAGTSGVRLAPDSEPCDVHLARGAGVLVVTAHTDGQAPSATQLAEHVDEVVRAIDHAGFTARVINDCAPGQLEAALRDGCDMLYAVCHGEEDLDRHGRLTLRGCDVTGRQLGEWLEAAADSTGRRVQAVLLCACSSAVPGGRPGTMGMAQHAAATDRRAMAALGFRAPVSVPWALGFMRQVFNHLATGASLEQSVARARQAQAEDDPQWSLPLMFAGERDPFTVTGQAHTPGISLPGLEAFVPAASPVRSLLPPPPRPYFTGRQPQLEALRAWRRTPGAAVLTALAGEGGIGKTEIARVLAHEVAVGGSPTIWLGRPDHDVEGCLAALIRQVHSDYCRPDGATRDDVRAIMQRELGPHAGLLVLDDVERVDTVNELTPGPRWHVLITTRRRGLLPGVVELEVEPLASADAIELLAKVARDGAPFERDEVNAASRLVEALCHLPLAIEVAAELLRRGATLDETRATALASDGDNSLVARIARVMDRSLTGLGAGDELAWALVAALPSAGVTEQDVALGLEESEGRAGRRLFRLRQANLFRFEPARARYTMHPLARQVACARAESASTWGDLLARAARVLLATVRWCHEPFGRDSKEAFRRWRQRRDFLETIDLSYWPPGAPGSDELSSTLTLLDGFRKFERPPDERLALLNAAAERARHPSTLAHALVERALLRACHSDVVGAEVDYTHALELITTAAPSDSSRARVHLERGALRRLVGDLDRADADYALALALYQSEADALGQANALVGRGGLRLLQRDRAGAAADYERALTLYDLCGDSLGMANVHRFLGDMHADAGRTDDAEGAYLKALPIYESVSEPLGLSTVLARLAHGRALAGDRAGARAYVEQAEPIAHARQNAFAVRMVARISEWIANGRVARFDDRAGVDEELARTLVNRGMHLGHQGRFEGAMAALDEVIRRFGRRNEAGLAEQVAVALVNKAIVLSMVDVSARKTEKTKRKAGQNPKRKKRRSGSGDAAIAACDEVIRRVGETDEPALAEQLARALVTKGGRLGRLGRLGEEVSVVDEFVRRFGERPEARFAEMAARMLVCKGFRLVQLNRPGDAIATFDEVDRRFGQREESALAALVATALVNKGSTLDLLGRPDDANAVYDEVIRRFGKHEDPAIVDQVALAQRQRTRSP